MHELDTNPDVAGEAEASGRAARLWAMLSLSLETTASAVRQHLSRKERLYLSMHRVPITCDSISKPGITDQPATMGPTQGRAWDVKRLTMASADPASPWTGVIYVYTGFPSASNLVDEFDGPGTHHYPKATVLLTGKERVVLVAGTAFAGVCAPGGAAISFIDEALPDYLT